MIVSNESREFINQSVFHMEESMFRIKKCMIELSDEDIWQRPNNSSNSIGNLIIHLCGNTTQYIISSLGGLEDSRNRDFEFEVKGGFTRNELLDKIIATINQAIEVIRKTNTLEMLREREVQGFNLSGIGIIIHVVEHLSYHTGQIAFWTKMIRDKDLGFYDGVDLNKKNS